MMKMDNKAHFGPAGNGDAFYAAGHKASREVPAWLSAQGLDAYEYQCGRGVRIGEAAARELGAEAALHGVRLSLHAPYFISLSGIDEQKRLGSLRYIMESLAAARAMGATRVVIHSGSVSGGDRAAALALARDTLSRAVRAADEAGYGDIALCPETMGKINQLGSLEEVLSLCSLDERLIPCVDFGHLNARTHGGMTIKGAYDAAFDTMENTIGKERTAAFHTHFSHIEYSKGGELRHLTFEDTIWGPWFEELAEAIVRRDYSPTLICESAGTQVEDARAMKRIYEKYFSSKR